MSSEPAVPLVIVSPLRSPRPCELVLFTAASRFALRFRTGGRGQKRLPTMVTAKVEPLSIAFGVESGCFVHGHSADGVFGLRFRFIHGHDFL